MPLIHLAVKSCRSVYHIEKHRHVNIVLLLDRGHHGLDLLRKLTSIRSCLALKRANLLSIAILSVAEFDVS